MHKIFTKNVYQLIYAKKKTRNAFFVSKSFISITIRKLMVYHA